MKSAAIFGLTKAETGRLFGISRQAIDKWYKKGVPTSRVADVKRVAGVARALHARFIPDRIPQIVREPLPGLQHQTILDALRRGGSVNVLALLNRAFSYLSDIDR